MVFTSKFFPFFFLFISTLFAQQKNYTVEGTVQDLYTGRAMPAVNVYIQELQRGAITDSAGFFRIENLKKGIYSLAFTRVGYQKLTRKIFFDKDRVVRL